MRCTEELDFFDLDERGLPRIAPDHQAAVDRLREDLIERHEFHLPRRKRPKPLRDYRTGPAAFGRHSPPDPVKDVPAAFADGSIKPHADGVSRLQDVPWMINEPMLPVVRKFAGDGVGSNVSRKQVL